MSFAPPDGSAPWSNAADGCHGAKAPAGAPAPRASDTGVSATEIRLGSVFGITGAGAVYEPIIKVIGTASTRWTPTVVSTGRKPTLDIEDQQYTPAYTKPLTQELVEEVTIFADISSLGTATNAQVFDYLNQQKVPQLFAATGAPQAHDVG